MEFFIHKDFSYLPFHLHLENGKLKKVDSIDEVNGLIVGTKEFELFSKLYLLTLPQYPPENYLKAYRSVLRAVGGQRVPWNYCLPQEVLINSITEIGNKLYEQIKNLDLEYYNNVFKKNNLILDSLETAKINIKLYEDYKDNTIINSFSLNETGYVELPIYSRVDTVTGRLKILSGPSILHLKKEYRNIISSRFGADGEIYYLDFKSLEPRLMLALNSLSGTLPLDIYGEIVKRINTNSLITREEIKKFVVSEMYGAGISSLKEQFKNLSEVELLRIVSLIQEYFGIKELKDILTKEYEENNKIYIKNLYKRYVSTIDTASYGLPNRFLQSSSVDISLYGFSNIVSYVKEMNWNEEIKFLFVIHDGLIIDIHKNHFNTIPTLCKVGAIDIPLLEKYNFYIRAEKIL